jgi:hypothetical protein
MELHRVWVSIAQVHELNAVCLLLEHLERGGSFALTKQLTDNMNGMGLLL